jgi:hypothetical protein
MQGFILAMFALILLGTIVQMIHHKNITYFFNNAKKAKLQATRELGTVEKAKILTKTTVYDIGTTSELGFGKRRLAHVLGMYGTIIFWVSSVLLVFFLYRSRQNIFFIMVIIMACRCNPYMCWRILVLVFFEGGRIR